LNVQTYHAVTRQINIITTIFFSDLFALKS